MITRLNLDLERGVHRFNIHIINDGMGNPILIPVMVAKGGAGPVLGITAALHGNEVNGVPVIQELFKQIDCSKLSGTVVGVLVSNVPGFLRKSRLFNDGADLNHIMPGKKYGTHSQVYAHRLVDRFLKQFDYHIDLHTASFGRVNTYYVRCDPSDTVAYRFAELQNADIILCNPAPASTLRGVASSFGIPSITVELRDPHMIQRGVVKDSVRGMFNVLVDRGMYPGEIRLSSPATVCEKSMWVYTDTGGLLEVLVGLREIVEEGQLIARTHNVFGDVIREYHSPHRGIVIGRSIEPVAQTGARIIHLGLY